MTDNDANIHTVSVSVPDWLKHCFDDVYDTDAPDYKKLAAVIKDNSSLSMTVTDLSDKTLDLAAADYCDDWYLLEPEQQQELRENLQDWIGALLVAGAISVSPKHEEPVAFCDNSFFEGIKAAKKRIKQVGKTKTLIEQMPDDAWKDWDRRNEDALVIDSSFDDYEK